MTLGLLETLESLSPSRELRGKKASGVWRGLLGLRRSVFVISRESSALEVEFVIKIYEPKGFELTGYSSDLRNVPSWMFLSVPRGLN